METNFGVTKIGLFGPFVRGSQQADSDIDFLIELKQAILSVRTPDDFVISSDGVLLLDAISIKLQVVGEMIKKIPKPSRNIVFYG